MLIAVQQIVNLFHTEMQTPPPKICLEMWASLNIICVSDKSLERHSLTQTMLYMATNQSC